MKRQVLKTTLAAFAVLLILMLGTANTPTLALPAADNLKPGEKMGYVINIVSDEKSVGTLDSFDNQTETHLMHVNSTRLFHMDGLEKATLSISAVADIGNGVKMAQATGTGNKTGSDSYYESTLVYDVVNQQYVDNRTYSGGGEQPFYTFTDEDRSFYFNATQVPLSDFVFYVLIGPMKEDGEEGSTGPSLAQDEGPIEVIDNFFANFTPVFVNSTYTGSGTYNINDHEYTLNTLTRRYYNRTSVVFQGEEIDMFQYDNVTGANWHYYISFDVIIIADITYDSSTGMLLIGAINGTATVSISAYTLVPNYDPDGDGPAQPFDLFVHLHSTKGFSTYNTMEINYISYLYQETSSTSTTTSENTTGTETTTTNETTPLLNLPGFTFETISLSFGLTIATMVVIRKRR